MYIYIYIYICLEATLGKVDLDESDFRYCYRNFLEKAIPKIKFFSTITRHTDNSMLKDILQLKI